MKKKEYKNFITKSFNKNIEHHLIPKKDSPTILKKRYVDNINKTKVIGVHNINDAPFNKIQEKKFRDIVRRNLKNFDLVVVSDYGHGLISDQTAKLILKNSKFLAVNAQINSANIGFHTISKYKGANLVIINENEMRHELRDKTENINKLIKILANKIKSKYLIVTSGKNGSKIYIKSNKKIIHCPAFAVDVNDKIGAGDTMLGFLSISLYKKIDINYSMFLSALAAAENVKHMANSLVIKKNTLIKYLDSYLK